MQSKSIQNKISTCKRYGRPVDDIERFWSYVDIKGKDECWEWKGGFSNTGYGAFQINGEVKSTHVIAYEISKGRIPDGKQVNHRCHNRACCNPFHVYEGTQKENIDDMIKANRQIHHYGEFHSQHKLTEKSIKEIRENKDNLSQRKLGLVYGVSHSVIGGIQRRIYWKYLE